MVNINIPEKYLHIYPGEPVLVETEIILVQENVIVAHDILIEYTIKNYNGSVVTKVMETKGGRERLSIVKELVVSSDAKPGIYTLEIKVNKGSVESLTTENFEVVEKILEPKKREKVSDYLMIAAVIFNFILILTIFFWERKHKL